MKEFKITWKKFTYKGILNSFHTLYPVQKKTSSTSVNVLQFDSKISWPLNSLISARISLMDPLSIAGANASCIPASKGLCSQLCVMFSCKIRNLADIRKSTWHCDKSTVIRFRMAWILYLSSLRSEPHLIIVVLLNIGNGNHVQTTWDCAL